MSTCVYIAVRRVKEWRFDMAATMVFELPEIKTVITVCRLKHPPSSYRARIKCPKAMKRVIANGTVYFEPGIRDFISFFGGSMHYSIVTTDIHISVRNFFLKFDRLVWFLRTVYLYSLWNAGPEIM